MNVDSHFMTHAIKVILHYNKIRVILNVQADFVSILLESNDVSLIII